MKDENGRLNVLKQRSKELDICKALLIILVVIGHANVDTRIIKIIFWFHIPVFFYLSGYLLHLPRKSEWKNWAIKKAFDSMLVLLGIMYIYRWKPYSGKFCSVCMGREATGWGILVCDSFIFGRIVYVSH